MGLMGLTSSKILTGTARQDVSCAEISSRDADLEAVNRVQQGDVEAFDQLVRKYRERIYAVIYNISGNHEDAADLTQDAFIKAFQSITKFRRKSSFYTWLYRIALNGALTHLKRSRRRRFFSLDNLDEEHVSQSEVVARLTAKHSTAKGAILQELQEKLNEAIQSLSLKHRTVVILHEIDGRSHQEIADIMGCSVGTVRSRLHYAKQQLQVALQHYFH